MGIILNKGRAEVVSSEPGGVCACSADDTGLTELADEQSIIGIVHELVGLAALPAFAIETKNDV